jgi:hypothetical protein
VLVRSTLGVVSGPPVAVGEGVAEGGGVGLEETSTCTLPSTLAMRSMPDPVIASLETTIG